MTADGKEHKSVSENIIARHPQSEAIVYHNKKYFHLRDEREIYIKGKSFSNSRYVVSGMRPILFKTLDRSKKRLKEGTLRWNKLHTAIVRNYMDILTEIIMDTTLEGDRLVTGKNLIGFHIFDMPTYMRVGAINYKYHRKINGAYPIMRVSVQSHRLKQYAYARNAEKSAFYIGAGVTKKMSGMLTHKINNENVRYSDDPWPTFTNRKIKLNG